MSADSKSSSPRTVTVVEGREENRRMVDDFAKEALKHGWHFTQLLGINSDYIARYDFGSIPLDHVIFRDLSKNSYIETDRFLHWLRQNRKICINANATGGRVSTSDKHFQQGLFMSDPWLCQYALPTFEAKSKANVLAYVKAGRIHYPFILKPRLGTTGEGILLIKEPADMDKIKNFHGFIIQQYIEPECDFRVFIVGGTAVGIMRKTGDHKHPGNFKAWSSGRDRYPETDPAVTSILSEIATRAAAVSHLEYTGVDILREAETGKYYLLETNFAAGWGNRFIEVTGANIPAFTIDWIEDVDAARHQPVATAVADYISKRKQFLPPKIQHDYDAIMHGDGSSIPSYDSTFANYPHTYATDAGKIFKTLSKLYQNFADYSKADRKHILDTIASLPLSWAGNFIGPAVGTLHDGAILSALYLSLVHQTTKT